MAHAARNHRAEDGHASVPRVLVVDDDELALRTYRRTLEWAGYVVYQASHAHEAVERMLRSEIDVVISDIAMPSVDGIELLRELHVHDPDLPVILVTAQTGLRHATHAVQYGAFRYLLKPVGRQDLVASVDAAARSRRGAPIRHLRQSGTQALGSTTDRVALSSSFERAIERLRIVYQPIVDAGGGAVRGYEALVRSDEPELGLPKELLDVAERLGRLADLGHRVRRRAVEPMHEAAQGALLFLNLHPAELKGDPLDPDGVLTAHAGRIVLEVTERASLHEVPDSTDRIADLRELGFRIAVDDLGAGYSGLSSFATLEPDFVKLDMSLVRRIDESATRQKLVGSMVTLAHDMGVTVVAEGIESARERDTLVGLGCDLLQGFRFARPAPPFPSTRW